MDLSAILSKPASEIQKPKPLPPGIYIGQISDYAAKTIGEKQTPAVEFEITVTQAVEVDDPSTAELPRKNRYLQFVTENSLHRFRTFLEVTLGIDNGGGQKTLFEMLPEAKGRMLRLQLIQKAYTPRDSSEMEMINEISAVYPLAD